MRFQVDKNGQGTVTIPKAIWTGKGWVDGTLLQFKFGPKGEIIIEETKNEK